jgi:hypothetical protein
VFVDYMYTPVPHPFIDGQDVIFFNMDDRQVVMDDDDDSDDNDDDRDDDDDDDDDVAGTALWPS